MKFPDPPKKENNLAAALALLMLMPFFILAKCFIIMMMWEWYIVAYFGANSISMAVAFGISLMISYMTHDMREKDERKPANIILYSIFFHSFILLLAWIGSFFV